MADKPTKAIAEVYEEALKTTSPMGEEQARQLLTDLESGKVNITVEVPKKPPEAASGFTEENVRKFILGEITFAQLEGMTMEHAYAAAHMAYILLQSGKTDEAQIIFEGLVIGNPYDAYFHSTLASIYQQQGKMDAAIEEFQIALNLDPQDIGALVNLGEILLQTDNVQDAILHFQMALAMDPEENDPATERGKALLGALQEKIEEVQGGEAPEKPPEQDS